MAPCEQITNISFNAQDRLVTIQTSDPAVQKKLLKSSEGDGDVYYFGGYRNPMIFFMPRASALKGALADD